MAYQSRKNLKDCFPPISFHLIKAAEAMDSFDYQNALNELNIAYSIQPDNPLIVFNLGFIYYNINDFEKAEKSFLFFDYPKKS